MRISEIYQNSFRNDDRDIARCNSATRQQFRRRVRGCLERASGTPPRVPRRCGSSNRSRPRRFCGPPKTCNPDNILTTGQRAGPQASSPRLKNCRVDQPSLPRTCLGYGRQPASTPLLHYCRWYSDLPRRGWIAASCHLNERRTCGTEMAPTGSSPATFRRSEVPRFWQQAGKTWRKGMQQPSRPLPLECAQYWSIASGPIVDARSLPAKWRITDKAVQDPRYASYLAEQSLGLSSTWQSAGYTLP